MWPIPLANASWNPLLPLGSDYPSFVIIMSCLIKYIKNGLRLPQAPSTSSCLRLCRCELDLASDIHVNRRDPIAPLVRVKGGDADVLQRRSHVLSGAALFFAVDRWGHAPGGRVWTVMCGGVLRKQTLPTAWHPAGWLRGIGKSVAVSTGCHYPKGTNVRAVPPLQAHCRVSATPMVLTPSMIKEDTADRSPLGRRRPSRSVGRRVHNPKARTVVWTQ